MDDMTTMMLTAPCTTRFLNKLNRNYQWARKSGKPSKSRSPSILRGKSVDKRSVVNDDVVPRVLDKPAKSFGWWYDANLHDKAQLVKLRQKIIQGTEIFKNSELPGKLKPLCLQFGLLPRLMWPPTVYEVPLSKVEMLEKISDPHSVKGCSCEVGSA